ncbi:MAG: alanine--tRNA ligase, partial [Gammaproteobacteria bacterium]|nr:alanine--tRNA ligase [Gammaproteobacteria bacterium]
DEAIPFAWELVTKEFGIDPTRLLTTVYHTDDEAFETWKKLGVPEDRIIRIATSDNFWQMGPTGPCGPCTEIFYDHGEDIPGGPPGTPEEDGDRYIEIWNLVFMQYNRSSDGELHSLPAPSVDTGMGLERLAAIMQGVHNNYDIDLFQHLIRAAAEATACDDLQSKSLRVIADHIRSCAFLITDGVMPSNEGRGYVLRRIIRRAARHGHKLGMADPFFYRLVVPLVEEMGEAYPELAAASDNVMRVLKLEEERFAETLDQGMRILEADISKLSGRTISGDTAFRLYDTYGFPLDLTADIARERKLTVDHAGFEVAMKAQRERARSASQFGVDYNRVIDVNQDTVFTGYDRVEQNSKILEIFVDGDAVDIIGQDQRAVVVLDETPFYAESGGQVGDTGKLISDSAVFLVEDTQKQGKAILHFGIIDSGSLRKGESAHAEINNQMREAIKRNHSATHLMHAALRNVLGDHVQQKGSLVTAERTRFDFSHFEPLTREQIYAIERQVNAEIMHNNSTTDVEMPLEEARKAGAMALFGEKYDDVVRVVSMGDYSTELCGGTHVERTGDIGFFKIIAESGVAAGVRRIEAVTGSGAVAWAEQRESQIDVIADALKSSRDEVEDKVRQLVDRLREQEKMLDQLKTRMASQAGSDLSSQAEEINGVKVLVARLDDADSKALRDTMDQLKNKLGSAAIVLTSEDDGKVRVVAGVTKDQTSTIKAGELVNIAAAEVGGKGGGRPDMAQAGGSQPENIDKALAAARAWLQDKLR